jgi:hypothetical protein
VQARARDAKGRWGVWHLLSSRPLSGVGASREYARRFTCEEGFRDGKRLLGFAEARIKCSEAWARMFLLAALALLVLTRMGGALLKRGDRAELLRRVRSRRRARSESGPFRRVGETPIRNLPLEMGSYLVVLKKEGYRDVRYPVYITRSFHWDGRVALYTDEEIGPGFVYVPAGPFLEGAILRHAGGASPLLGHGWTAFLLLSNRCCPANTLSSLTTSLRRTLSKRDVDRRVSIPGAAATSSRMNTIASSFRRPVQTVRGGSRAYQSLASPGMTPWPTVNGGPSAIWFSIACPLNTSGRKPRAASMADGTRGATASIPPYVTCVTLGVRALAR